jgi:hypothetical protein
MYPSVLADAHLDIRTVRPHPETLAKMEEDFEVGRRLVGEVLVRALRSVGSAKAALLAEKAGVAGGLLEIRRERVDVDELSGGVRRRALPRVTRDLERALGPADRSESLEDLAKAARIPISHNTAGNPAIA